MQFKLAPTENYLMDGNLIYARLQIAITVTDSCYYCEVLMFVVTCCSDELVAIWVYAVILNCNALDSVFIYAESHYVKEINTILGPLCYCIIFIRVSFKYVYTSIKALSYSVSVIYEWENRQ